MSFQTKNVPLMTGAFVCDLWMNSEAVLNQPFLSISDKPASVCPVRQNDFFFRKFSSLRFPEAHCCKNCALPQNKDWAEADSWHKPDADALCHVKPLYFSIVSGFTTALFRKESNAFRNASFSASESGPAFFIVSILSTACS